MFVHTFHKVSLTGTQQREAQHFPNVCSNYDFQGISKLLRAAGIILLILSNQGLKGKCSSITWVL